MSVPFCLRQVCARYLASSESIWSLASFSRSSTVPSLFVTRWRVGTTMFESMLAYSVRPPR